MNDKIIIEFQQGDKESYRLIFDSLYSTMCLFANKFIHDYDDAEDIVQEVFIELWHQRVKFESIYHIKSFLYLSIKNRCINYKKHLLSKEKHSKSIIDNNDLYFEDYVLEAEVIQNLNNAINNLPEQRKQVILLSMQGLKNNEIAEDMRISIDTVKLHKKLAYKQLREKLNPSLSILLLLS
ncbi:MAG: RNA polymerase sigma-70 factor [Bacteroidales bacterium]|nr:MAG: RNA polymerase sigma-70 factor [Bacteroidales bacterium]